MFRYRDNALEPVPRNQLRSTDQDFGVVCSLMIQMARQGESQTSPACPACQFMPRCADVGMLRGSGLWCFWVYI
eukprot:3940587-Rhodomonas_salina.3